MAGRAGRSSRSGSAEATRRALLRAGRRAFARKGLAGANLRDDVLAPAGISVGSFYHQFEDKSDLLLAILDDGARRLGPRLEALSASAAGGGRAALAGRFYDALLDWSRRNRELWRIGARERFGGDARVRRRLAREREAWGEALASALGRQAGRRLSARASRELADWMVRLAYACADDQLRPRSRGDRAATGSARAALLGLTLEGSRGLRRGRRPPARPDGG